jgi:hypothetical protein
MVKGKAFPYYGNSIVDSNLVVYEYGSLYYAKEAMGNDEREEGSRVSP